MNNRLILPGLVDSHTHPDLIAATASTKAAFDLPFTYDKEEIGSIEVGKSADLVVLDEDLFTVAKDRIREIKPVAVMMEGAVIHGRLN
jgi:predicted amidohydrolase YtcJ